MTVPTLAAKLAAMWKRHVKQWVLGTPFEPLARRVGAWLSPPPPPSLDDQRTEAILARVLGPGDSCVDVGCHEGAVLRSMLAHAPQGRHFAFEPLPHLAAVLRRMFRDRPQVTVLDLALSDRSGERTFQHVRTNPAYSGFLRRRYDRPGEEVEEIRVRTAALDDVLPADLPIRLVKVDVEGAELEVLRGAVRTLTRYRPVVVFEHGLGAADVYGAGPADLWELLVDRCGLRVSLLQAFLDGAPPLSREGFEQQFAEHLAYYFVAHP